MHEESREEIETVEQAADASDTPVDGVVSVADASDGEGAMRDMIDYIARVLVDDDDSVHVETRWSDDRLTVKLSVAESDKGKVIGRNGRVVHAMQSLLRVAATKSNIRVTLDVD